MTRAPDAREGTTDAPTTNPEAVDIFWQYPEALVDPAMTPVAVAHHRRNADREDASPIHIEPSRLPAVETEARR